MGLRPRFLLHYTYSLVYTHSMVILKPVLRSQQITSIRNMSFEALLKAQGHLCFYCNHHMPLDGITKDHMFPKCHGFHLRGNMVLAHKRCNGKKGSRYPTTAELLKWVALYTNKPKKHLIIRTKNNKPRFKLKITAELIHDFLS
jgi:5-methylcytosine-specific restriction endonuclease McrA